MNNKYNKLEELMQSRIFWTSIAALGLIGSVTAGKLNYNANRGYSAVQYSAAAYCSYETIDSWSCGAPCGNHTGVGSITRIHNSTDNTFAFVAYDSTNSEIIVSFRGTNGVDFENWATNLDWTF